MKSIILLERKTLIHRWKADISTIETHFREIHSNKIVNHALKVSFTTDISESGASCIRVEKVEKNLRIQKLDIELNEFSFCEVT